MVLSNKNSATWLSLSLAAWTKWSASKTQRQISELQHIIRHRRSIFPKQYSNKRVPRKVLQELLEAARWAPSHKLTEAWKFIVYESPASKAEVGQLFADQYKLKCEITGNKFLEAKYEKLKTVFPKSSFMVAIICNKKGKNPWWEEVASVAMAVQNMLLVAAAHEIGAYWSSAGANLPGGDTSSFPVQNPPSTTEFLELAKDGTEVCLGFLLVGDYYGNDEERAQKNKAWPESRRQDLVESGRVHWK